MTSPAMAWQVMITLLRAMLQNVSLTEAEKEYASIDILQDLYTISKKFDVTYIISQELYSEGLLCKTDTLSAQFEKAQLLAVMRYEQSEQAFSAVAEVLESARIAYMPLKGIEIRKYYPEPWMRTSCDIDILVHAEDVDRAVQVLTTHLSYVVLGRSPYDVPLRSDSDVTVELHYSLEERQPVMRSNAVLCKVWEHAISNKSGSYRVAMSDAMYYFYHIAHMAKHFEQGGCGVRPFMDLWILDQRVSDMTDRYTLLEQGGLKKFADACKSLSEVWFGQEAPSILTDNLENFIISGGMYGTVDNMVAVRKRQDGGGAHYIRNRLFMPYERLKNVYPILQKHKWLTPVMEVRRWIKMITDGRMNRTVRELQSLKSNDRDAEIDRLLRELALNVD